VDEHYCLNHNIAVYNVPEYSTDSVAELTIALAISLLRRIPQGSRIIKDGGWDTPPGLELANRTVAIIGTGAIGCRVATLFKALGCEIQGWSRTRKEEFISTGGKYFSSVSEAVKDADIVSIHLPANESTKGIINNEVLKSMKPYALIINTARGPIIDEKALTTALETKSIGGAALDVYDTEPLPETHPFRSMDNVLALPHIAFKTKEALLRKAQITVDNINAFSENSTKNRVI
jgi:D-3-phosphoglycerate dehydrogenase